MASCLNKEKYQEQFETKTSFVLSRPMNLKMAMIQEEPVYHQIGMNALKWKVQFVGWPFLMREAK